MPRKNFIKANLFWKIFFWFWLSFVLIFILNLYILQLNNDSIRYHKTPTHLTEQVVSSKERISSFLTKKVAKKSAFNNKWENVFVLSPDGIDRLGKPVPDILLSLDQYVQKSQQTMSVVSKDKIIFGGILLVDGQFTYRVYIRRIFSYLSGDYMASFFQEFAYSILISTFLISFPLSFLLAWLVVGPIKRLQQATRDISYNINDRNNLKLLLTRNDEFAELAMDFEAMRKQIEHQLTARTRLISDVSHELRAPLTRMQIAIGIANNKLNKDGNNSELDRIKIEAKRMNVMLTDLLDFTKLDSFNCHQEIENINISQLLITLIADAKFEAEQVGVTIDTRLSQGEYIKGNKTELLSCLENIIRNAIRYAKTNITLCCHKNEHNSAIIITIIDDGDGVPEEDIDKIFDAFYRPSLDRSRQSGGVGLGLSIAQKAVVALSGKIWAENMQPSGFSIHIALPING
jgi:two-component system sensor histidine kinase CpxA